MVRLVLKSPPFVTSEVEPEVKGRSKLDGNTRLTGCGAFGLRRLPAGESERRGQHQEPDQQLRVRLRRGGQPVAGAGAHLRRSLPRAKPRGRGKPHDRRGWGDVLLRRRRPPGAQVERQALLVPFGCAQGRRHVLGRAGGNRQRRHQLHRVCLFRARPGGRVDRLVDHFSRGANCETNSGKRFVQSRFAR